MSNTDFTDITADVDAVLADATLSPAIADHRAEMTEADRRYAMGLAAVRHAFDFTQTELAERLDVFHANVAKIEKGSDLLVSTLRYYLLGHGRRGPYRRVIQRLRHRDRPRRSGKCWHVGGAPSTRDSPVGGPELR